MTKHAFPVPGMRAWAPGIQHTHCQWIASGVEPSADVVMCGAAVQAESSYCPYHHARAYRPAPKLGPRETRRVIWRNR